MQLQETTSLINLAVHSTDKEKLRQQFLSTYQELDTAYPQDFSFEQIVRTAFTNLSPRDYVVKAYRITAAEIAARIDHGDDGTNRNKYHCRLHFAKVVLNARCLAALHNQWVDKRLIRDQPKLTNRDIAALIYAGTMHDLGHDGTGNMVDERAIPFLLEQKSIDLAKNWNGITHLGLIEDAARLVRATDVFGNPSAANFVRAWYDYYADRERNPMPGPLPPHLLALQPLLESPKLTILAALLQDADVFASMIDRLQQMKESTLFAAERGTEPTAASEKFFFMDILSERATADITRKFSDEFIKMRAKECRDALVI